MKSDKTKDLAKLHCLLNLFHETTGGDTYALHQIKEAIEASLPDQDSGTDSLTAFTEAAFELFRQEPALRASYGFRHLDFSEVAFDPLFVRGQLLEVFRELAGFQNALLVITGLKDAIAQQPSGRRGTKARSLRHEQAIDYIDQLALKWTTTRTRFQILYI